MKQRTLHRLTAPLRRFLRDERGTMLVETLLILPMMLWAAFALYVYWDAYATINKVQKATYTVADILSRSRTNIGATEATGLEDLFNFLMPGDQTGRMRLTSVIYNAANTRFEVQWSCSLSPTDLPALTTTTVQALNDKLPLTSNADTLLIVETRFDFEPILDIGLNNMTLQQFVATRPRFVTAVGFISTSPADCS